MLVFLLPAIFGIRRRPYSNFLASAVGPTSGPKRHTGTRCLGAQGTYYLLSKSMGLKDSEFGAHTSGPEDLICICTDETNIGSCFQLSRVILNTTGWQIHFLCR